MSGWKLLCLEPVTERRDATEDEDSYDGYFNPNHAIYHEVYGDYDSEDHMWASDRIKKILVEEYGAMVDSKHGTVFACMGGYDANWGAALRDTFLMWDKAAVVEANDTSDTGKVHVYERTWDGVRGRTRRDLPKTLCVEEGVFHDTRHDAIGVATCHENEASNTDRELDVTYINSAWMVYSERQWNTSHGEGRTGLGLSVNDWTDGRHPLDNTEFDHPDDVPLSAFKVDEWSEVECRDGRPVGEKAAAYAQFEWNIHTRAGTPMGWNWDHTRAEPLEWRYKVCMEDASNAVEERTDLFGHGYEVDNLVLEADRRWESRNSAVGHAATLERETGLDTWVEPVPVSSNWGGGIDREFDPMKYPDYDRGALDQSPRPEQYRKD
jgi:hypothetical protein